jgi:hypothetical protein
VSQKCKNYYQNISGRASEFYLERQKKGVEEMLETHEGDRSVLISDALAELPEKLCAELWEAIEEADLEKTNSLIDRIREQNIPLAESLADLVRQFRFDILLQLFKDRR